MYTYSSTRNLLSLNILLLFFVFEKFCAHLLVNFNWIFSPLRYGNSIENFSFLRKARVGLFTVQPWNHLFSAKLILFVFFYGVVLLSLVRSFLSLVLRLEIWLIQNEWKREKKRHEVEKKFNFIFRVIQDLDWYTFRMSTQNQIHRENQEKFALLFIRSKAREAERRKLFNKVLRFPA